MITITNAINWFEIPATDFERAVAFYGAALDTPISKGEFNGFPHGFIPAAEQGITGAIVKGNGEPSQGGPLLYLNAQSQANMDAILARVVAHGGQVVLPTVSIAPQGYMAIIIDSEGNRIGLHAV